MQVYDVKYKEKTAKGEIKEVSLSTVLPSEMIELMNDLEIDCFGNILSSWFELKQTLIEINRRMHEKDFDKAEPGKEEWDDEKKK